MNGEVFTPEVAIVTPELAIQMMRDELADIKAACVKTDPAADPLEDVRDLHDRIEDFDAALLKAQKKIADEVLDRSGAKAVIVQMKGPGARIDPLSIRGQLAALMKPYAERIEAEKPPMPTHTYVVRITCTDALLNTLLKKAAKDGAEGVLAATPQSDKAIKVIQKWFDENV